MKLLLWCICIIPVLVASAGDVNDGYDDLIKEIFTTTPKPNTQGGSLEDLVNDYNNNNNKPQDPPNPNREGQIIADAKYCDGGKGQCVPYYLCANNEVITDGTGIIDIRFQEDSPCSYLETCCGTSNVAPPDPVSPPVDPVKPPVNNGNNGYSGNIVVEPITPPPLKHVGCGYRNENGIAFKISGSKDNEAEYGEFPWMVAILKEEEIGGQLLNVYQCGGALITPSVVLTAAHCVKIYEEAPHKLKIRAGEWDTQTKNEVFEHQDRNVYEVIAHKEFYKGGLYNDVALVFLSNPVDMSHDNVGLVCLPPQGQLFDHSRCFASGWGKDVFGKEGKYQVILKKVSLPVVPHDQCEQALRTTRLGARFNLHPSFLCAGGEAGHDTCKGDGGSPLVCPISGTKDRYYQAGIVAWGIGCGENQIPGVYANVAGFREWIDHQLVSRNMDKTYYEYL